MVDMCCVVLAGHAERLSWRLNPVLPPANSTKRLNAEYGIKATGASYQLVKVKIRHTFNSALLRRNCETYIWGVNTFRIDCCVISRLTRTGTNGDRLDFRSGPNPERELQQRTSCGVGVFS